MNWDNFFMIYVNIKNLNRKLLKILNDTKKIKTYNSEKSAFSSWLYTIARNTVIDHYRTKKVHKDIEDVWDLSDNTDIEHDLDVTLEMDKVKEHMKGLKSTQRDIIIMRVWQGLRYKEIADILGKSEASCKMTYSRGMKALRESMALAVIMLIML